MVIIIIIVIISIIIIIIIIIIILIYPPLGERTHALPPGSARTCPRSPPNSYDFNYCLLT